MFCGSDFLGSVSLQVFPQLDWGKILSDFWRRLYLLVSQDVFHPPGTPEGPEDDDYMLVSSSSRSD
jgi:hypothetical protein